MTLRRLKVDVTTHGFRSAFRDRAAERSSFPSEVVEIALAHTIGSKVEAAYRRDDLFEKRRKLMEAWAALALSRRAGRSCSLDNRAPERKRPPHVAMSGPF